MLRMSATNGTESWKRPIFRPARRFQTGLQWSAMPADVTPTAMTAHPAPIMTATSDPAPVIAATAVPAPIIAAPIVAAPIVAAPRNSRAHNSHIRRRGNTQGVSIRIVLNTLNRQTDRDRGHD